jgi:hypothetical protein
MFILKSRSAAHAFVDIVRHAAGNPHLADVIEANAPAARRNRRALERHVERALEAAEVIAAACHEQPRKGMPVPIDIRDRAIRSALVAMLDLYMQLAELGDIADHGADALDVAEIRMTIQAALDRADMLSSSQGVGNAVAPVVSPVIALDASPGSAVTGLSTSMSSLNPTNV